MKPFILDAGKIIDLQKGLTHNIITADGIHEALKNLSTSCRKITFSSEGRSFEPVFEVEGPVTTKDSEYSSVCVEYRAEGLVVVDFRRLPTFGTQRKHCVAFLDRRTLQDLVLRGAKGH